MISTHSAVRTHPDAWVPAEPQHLLPGIQRPQAWMTDGLCRQVDPEIFYPEKGDSAREAKSVCANCPVIAECLTYALEHQERHGVWGGLSNRERRKLERAGRKLKAIEHGTSAGYAAHRRRNEDACIRCLNGLAGSKRSRRMDAEGGAA